MSITADELMGQVAHGLSGSRRVVVTTDRAREMVAEERLRRAQVRSKSKAWRKANPETVKAYMARWRRENRGKVLAYNARWTGRNPEKVKALRRESNRRYYEKRKAVHAQGNQQP